MAERFSSTGYKIIIGILVLIIVVVVAFYNFASVSAAGEDKARAERNVVELYKVITGGDAEVLKTVEQSGVYKLTVRFKDATGRDTLEDIFVTKDGLFFTNRLVDLEVQKSLFVNQSSFANCLFNKQVRILGLSNDASTQAQLQALGAFSARLYVDCSGVNLALCQQLNLTRVPVIFYNNQLFQGPQNIQWFEQNVGCYMTSTGTAGNATGP